MRKVANAILLILLFFSFILTLISFNNSNGNSNGSGNGRSKKARYSFIYPAQGARVSFLHSPYNIECRFLARQEADKNIRAYIEDLLLGPIKEGSAPIFPIKSTLLSLAQNGNTLYIGLSSEAEKTGDKVTDIDASVRLFKKNIQNNFRNVKKIVVFIGDSECV